MCVTTRVVWQLRIQNRDSAASLCRNLLGNPGRTIDLGSAIVVSTGQQLWFPSSQIHEPWWQMETTNQELNQKSDRKIKIHSHEKRNDNRTTESKIKTISALHVVCGFVCVLSTCQIISSRHVCVTAMQTRDLERSICAKTSNKGGGRKHETTLNLWLLNQQLGRAGIPNLTYKNYLGALPILKRPNYVRNSILVEECVSGFFFW